MFPNMASNIFYPEIYQLANWDVLVQSGYTVIHKTAFANLCKKYHDFVIIQSFNLQSEWKKRLRRGELKQI